jgi:hypothetical protein
MMPTQAAAILSTFMAGFTLDALASHEPLPMHPEWTALGNAR